MKRCSIRKMILVFLSAALAFCPVYEGKTSAYDRIDGNIRIGLYFNEISKGISEAVFSFNVRSGTGLEVMHKADGKMTSLAEAGPEDVLMVRKDTWFLENVNGCIEYSPDRVPVSGDKKGPFHVKTGAIYGNRENAEKIVKLLASKGIDAFLVFDGRWFVWSGFHPDRETAERAAINIRKQSGDYKCEAVENERPGIVIYKGGKPVLEYLQTTGSLCFKPLKSGSKIPLLKIENREYRGIIEVTRKDGSDMTVVNEVGLEEYLYGVVPCEMEAGAHMEALKAQAVAARTYAIRNSNKYEDLGFNLCDSSKSQVYKGYSVERPSTNEAVNATRGQIVIYNGTPAATYYFSSSGGKTENVKNVWDSELPYLVSVEDRYEKGDSRNYNWEAVYTARQIREEIKSNVGDLGNIQSVAVSRYSDTGRVVEMTIKGSRGEETFRNIKCRSVLDSLKSQMYTINTDADICATAGDGKPVVMAAYGKSVLSSSGTHIIKSDGNVTVMGASGNAKKVPAVATEYRFTGKGWGHGVGMSQEGAKGMAEAGYGYIDILKHYYPGTEVK